MDRTFDEAAAELHKYAGRASTVEAFGRAASLYSEDEASRVSQGRLGWLHRTEEGIDPALLEAVFAATPNSLIGPVRIPVGQALAWVDAIQPAPERDAFRRAVRRSFHQDLRKEILAEVVLKTIYFP